MRKTKPGSRVSRPARSAQAKPKRPKRDSRPATSCASALERADKILAKELRNRETLDHANINVREIDAIRELVRDAGLKRAEAILKDLRDVDGELCSRREYYALAMLSELRTVHALVLDARKSLDAAAA